VPERLEPAEFGLPAEFVLGRVGRDISQEYSAGGGAGVSAHSGRHQTFRLSAYPLS
jgi:hypothetical protein